MNIFTRLSSLAAIVALVACAGAACVSVGEPIDPAKLERLETGITTRAAAVQLFGEPDTIETRSDGVVVLAWAHFTFSEATYLALEFGPDNILQLIRSGGRE